MTSNVPAGISKVHLIRAAIVLLGAAGAVSDGRMANAEESSCAAIAVYEGGRAVAQVCQDKLDRGLDVLDLSDRWAPRIFSETPDHPQTYRSVFVDLANGEIGEGRDAATARRDRQFELFGIFPSFSVIRARLLDERRHACHAAIDDRALRALTRTVAPWSVATSGPGPKSTAVALALAAVQSHLRCEGLLTVRTASGRFDGATQEALRAYQRRYMVPSAPVLDEETRATLLTDSRELDFRALLRALRERVVDATGLIEDGSASNAWQPILGRFIESPEYRRPVRPDALEGGAPDLVAPATEAAARALGWDSPAGAARALAGAALGLVALRLPAAPGYHTDSMHLHVEIDRGDVWTSRPLDSQGRPRRSPVKNRPTFTLFAETPTGDLPLVRWPTTIGAWKPEKQEDGSESLRYKASPVGRWYWRDLIAAPAWFPPPTTPDRELMRRGPDGHWTPDQDAVGPGYRSAYGLVALVHHRAIDRASGGPLLVDLEIRTHGSGNYRSILRGSSHGCHRLFNHFALRLGSFLLAHRETIRHGVVDEPYQRSIEWRGRAYKLRAHSRGYRYELTPPVTVDVLPGHIVRSKRSPGSPPPVRPPAPAPASPPGGPQT